MEIEKVLAMTVAAIAEENDIEAKHVVVRFFREIKKSDLEQYISDNNITYHKYQLGE